MDKYFKRLLFTGVAFIICLAGCTSDKGSEISEDKAVSVLLKVDIAEISKAETATAVGVAPDVEDMKVVFVGENVVKAIFDADVDEIISSGETFANIPESATTIYVVGNTVSTADTDASMSALQVGDSEAQLLHRFIDMSKQGLGTASNVNVLGMETFTPAAGTVKVSVEVVPAVSCIEIAKVAGETDPQSEGGSPLTTADGKPAGIVSFVLEGIFVNNTFAKISMDCLSYPTSESDIIAYDEDASVWADPSAYPARYRDIFPSYAASAVKTPSGGSVWSYYVAPAAKYEGGSFKGNIIGDVQYGALPVLILKFAEVNVTENDSPVTLNNKYITITKFLSEGRTISHLDPGKVYEINSINFNRTHLSDKPMGGMVENNCEVTVTIKTWEGVPTTTEIDVVN